MGYDFFVFPAEQADDLAQARSLYESSSGTGALTPGSPMAEFLASLDETARTTSEHGFLVEEADGDDGSAYVATSWDDPATNLRTVAGLARPHGLSVLDVQLDALFDPRLSVEVALETQGGPVLPYLTRAILREVMSHILELRYHWLVLYRAPEVYAQTYRDDDGSWAVEHRDGSPDQHFAARTRDASLVEDVLWSWARDDGHWQAMLEFSPVRL